LIHPDVGDALGEMRRPQVEFFAIAQVWRQQHDRETSLRCEDQGRHTGTVLVGTDIPHVQFNHAEVGRKSSAAPPLNRSNCPVWTGHRFAFIDVH
jgi:hypothetical protein